MTRREFDQRLARAGTLRGGEAIALRVADWTIRFEGIAPEDRDALALRWGPFAAAPGGSADLRVSVRDAGHEPWAVAPDGGEPYRLEAVEGEGPTPVVSYAFGLGASGEGAFVLALSRSYREPPPKSLDNAARLLVARLAAAAGGIALHGAGVVRRERGCTADHMTMGVRGQPGGPLTCRRPGHCPSPRKAAPGGTGRARQGVGLLTPTEN